MKLKRLGLGEEGLVEADWPAAPRIGHFVAVDYPGGRVSGRVAHVTWVAAADGGLLHLEIMFDPE